MRRSSVGRRTKVKRIDYSEKSIRSKDDILPGKGKNGGNNKNDNKNKKRKRDENGEGMDGSVVNDENANNGNK